MLEFSIHQWLCIRRYVVNPAKMLGETLTGGGSEIGDLQLLASLGVIDISMHYNGIVHLQISDNLMVFNTLNNHPRTSLDCRASFGWRKTSDIPRHTRNKG